MSQAQEKTEKPTHKKLEEARKRGNVAKSRDLNTIVVLAGGAASIYLSSGLIARHFKDLVTTLWGEGFAAAVKGPPSVNLLMTVVVHFSIMILPVILSTAIMGIAANLIQTKGFMLSLEAIQPSLSKLDPIKGFQRFFSLRSLIELVKSLAKIFIIAYVVYSVYVSELDLLGGIAGVEVGELLKVFSYLSLKVLVRVGAIMVLFAILDFYYQRWQHEKDLRMTKHEVKEEHKEMETDPQIKKRIRSIQQKLAQQRTMDNVPKASVVITNPTHYAVALLYTPEMDAPKVVAKGMDFVAKKIRSLARKHNVPIVSNPPLARALYSSVEVEGSIPVTLYQAVAKVLAYIYQQKGHSPL